MNDALTFQLAAPDLAPWRAGNCGVEGVWRFDSGRPGRQVLVTALVHGNELCGAWALQGLLEAGLRPRRGGLVLAFCNLAAFDTFDAARHDAARFVDEDMNRQWSPERLADASTQERRRAVALAPFVAAADWLLDLHSMHEPGAPLSLAGLSPANLALAVQLGAPEHIVVDAGHQDGVRMRDFGRFAEPAPDASGVRSLLVECGFHGDPASRAVAQDQCLRFLDASGNWDAGEVDAALPGWRLPAPAAQWVLEVTGGVVARSERFRFTQPFRGLEVIAQRGTLIGFDEGPVVTPYDDCVLVMPSVRQARAGVTVVRFARRTAAPVRPLVPAAAA
ncbi:MAG: succinylglutamate desuccinylase/aspartoacylase family protein [Pseudomonadota bacterium]